ncbi:MAG TPA: hypothetical protein VFT06_04585 [Flavisolibacter sp.]|nr:hypothetical protein [Flavisolibacter sp.]
MNKDIAIATISWARNREEEEQLRVSLQKLAALQVPVFITDGGSSTDFQNFLHSLPQFTVLAAKGLWAQAKSSLAGAARSGAQTILYTEPDKEAFFSAHLPQLLQKKPVGKDEGVVLASRSANGFASFPAFQQMTETTINNCCREIIGKEVDYCYGPFFFNSRLVAYLDVLPENCGWGWRPFLFVVAHRLGLPVNALTGDFACPPDQCTDDAGERIYRMKQLAQNIEGMVLATAVSLHEN